MRDKCVVLRRNVLALLHVAICLIEGLCDGDILVTDTRGMKGLDYLIQCMIGNNGRHNALHEHHLRNQSAPHLPHTHDACADDLALCLAFREFLIYIQHAKLLLLHH